MGITKQCPICGINFKINRNNPNQICCTIKCKKELTKKNKTKQCEYCNKSFVADSVKKNRFCSKQCAYDSSRTLTNVFKCKECGKEFRERSSSRDSNTFCSRDCSFKNMNKNKLSNILTKEELSKRNKELREKNKIIASKIYFNICKECSKTFTSRTKNRSICSNKCYYERTKKEIEKECTECGTKFTTKIKTVKTCCVQCEKQRLENKIKEKKNL
jgi:DNA-directed RNA polymerase subunit RPC12/RpoP